MHRPVNTEIELNKEKMHFLVNLLIYVIVAAPLRALSDQYELEKREPSWNPLKFHRDLVWKYLDHVTDERKHTRLKRGTTALFLQQVRKSIEADRDDKTYRTYYYFEDILLGSSYQSSAHDVRLDIQTLAQDFCDHPISHFRELLLDPLRDTNLHLPPRNDE